MVKGQVAHVMEYSGQVIFKWFLYYSRKQDLVPTAQQFLYIGYSGILHKHRNKHTCDCLYVSMGCLVPSCYSHSVTCLYKYS